MSKIKFRILSCTSQDSQYPASELLTQSPQSRGWQSSRYCDFPQEVTFQFMSPIRLKQLQILCHQSKIPSKIEIFVYLPDMTSPLENNQYRYKKLGYISLDTNERSDYQARELKSVFLDNPCLYMKLSFHKCHTNKFNLFNQVALIAISVFGDYLTVNEVPKQSKPNPLERLEYETQFDPTTLDRLKVLESAKEKAIRIDDFEEAKRLKEAIDRLKQIGVQLQHLEERKLIAVQNEDFDSAKIIKAEVDRLRNAMAPEALLGKYGGGKGDLPPVKGNTYRPYSQDKNPAMVGGPPSSNPQNQQNKKEIYNNPENDIKTYQKPSENPFAKKNAKTQNLQPSPSEPEMENISVVVQEDNSMQEKEQPINDRQMRAMKKNEKNENLRAIQKDIVNNHDEQVLPAVLKGPKNFEDDPDAFPEEEKQNNKKIEPLSQETLKLVGNMIDYITERCCQQLFSKTWANREEGLKFLESELKRPTQIRSDDQSGLFQAILGAINYTINDKISQVAQRAMSLLIALTSKPGKVSLRGEANNYMENILDALLDRIGDNNARVKELGENAFFSMANHNAIGVQICVNSLIKGIQGEKKQKSNSFKHLAARLNLLTEFTKKFGMANNGVPFETTVDFAVKHLEHSNGEVRNGAIALLVEISRNVGEQKLIASLGNVRPAQMEILQAEFSAAGGGGGGYVAPKKGKELKEDKEDVVVTTNIQANSQKSKKLNSSDSDKILKKGGIADKDKTCTFCGKIDKSFLENGRLDIHLWKECPLLTVCTMCNQVVEISCLNTHYLDECEYKKSFRKCPRCKEAIHSNNFKEHTEEMACLPFKNLNVANRCSLCHTDIMPGETGWKTHLIAEGCPNNERT